MRFGEIIKKAWHITWHYRWLWVLGMFAGATGGSGGGGGGGGNSSGFGQSTGSGTGSSGADLPDFSGLMTAAERWLPIILIVAFLLIVIGIAFAIISIGARGGLIWAVNEIEDGRPTRLSDAWNAGFARFWSILGLGIVLQLPLAIAGLVMAAIVLVPIFGPLLRGNEPDAAAVLAPMCGTLAIGIPLLLVAAVVLGVMYITGLRFVMLDGMGTMAAATESWRALRARFGDHAIMYVISLGLGIAASFALAIPAVILAVGTILPAMVAAMSENWGTFAGMIGLFVLLVMALSLAFSAIWGTFTSAMWTIFFRRLTGREVPPPIPVREPSTVPVAYPPPAPPAVDAPDA